MEKEMINQLMDTLFETKETMSDGTYKTLIEMVGKLNKLNENKKEDDSFEKVEKYGVSCEYAPTYSYFWSDENCKPYLLTILKPYIVKDTAPDCKNYSFDGNTKRKQILYTRKKIVVMLPYKVYKNVCSSKLITCGQSKLYDVNIDKTTAQAYILANEYPVVSSKLITQKEYELFKDIKLN